MVQPQNKENAQEKNRAYTTKQNELRNGQTTNTTKRNVNDK